MLNKEFGGTVMKKDIREDGQFKITVETSSALFRFVLTKKTVEKVLFCKSAKQARDCCS